MVLFPYKKIVIETGMSEEEFFSKLNEITDKSTLFDFGCSDNYFIGDVISNKFTLKIALKNYKEKDYESLHQTKIKGNYQTKNINLKLGYGFRYHLRFLLHITFVVFLTLDWGFTFSWRSFILIMLLVLIPFSLIRDYKHYKENCKEIERKFLELSEGKLCKKS